MNPKTLREEWDKACSKRYNKAIIPFWNEQINAISDWWLSKFTAYQEELRKDMESLLKEEPEEYQNINPKTYQTIGHLDIFGYNQGVTDAKSLLSKEDTK